MTFIYELYPYFWEIHQMCKYELCTLTVIVIQLCRQTDKLRVVTSGHMTKMAVTIRSAVVKNTMLHANLMA